MGTMGSRSLQVGGTAVQAATDEVLEKARRLAAHLLEADAGDIEVVPGQGLGVAGSPASRDPVGAAGAAAAKDPSRAPEGFEGGLAGENDFETPDATYPFGTHLAVVEVDTETGLAQLVRHITVDDSGRIHNQMLLEGQVHGGIAQGVAQALFEEIAYDEDGNNVTGSLASYAIPSAGDLPSVRDRAHGDADPAQPARRQGHRRVGRDRLDARRLERGRRRARSPSACATSTCRRRRSASGRRSAPPADLGERAREGVDVRDRRPEPDARPDRPGQLGLAAVAQLVRAATAPRPRARSSRRVISGCAQKQPWRTPIA